jgi:hypothetical protein
MTQVPFVNVSAMVARARCIAPGSPEWMLAAAVCSLRGLDPYASPIIFTGPFAGTIAHNAQAVALEAALMPDLRAVMGV